MVVVVLQVGLMCASVPVSNRSMDPMTVFVIVLRVRLSAVAA
jgi:hypothetical protein